MQLHIHTQTHTKDNTVQYLHGHTVHPLIYAITCIQCVPKRDPRKQEMTAEGRSHSRERTDTIRPLSRRRGEGGRGRESGERREDTASSTMAGKESKALDTTEERKSIKKENKY